MIETRKSCKKYKNLQKPKKNEKKGKKIAEKNAYFSLFIVLYLLFNTKIIDIFSSNYYYS